MGRAYLVSCLVVDPAWGSIQIPGSRPIGRLPLQFPFASQRFDFAHRDALSVVEGQALALHLEAVSGEIRQKVS